MAEVPLDSYALNYLEQPSRTSSCDNSVAQQSKFTRIEGLPVATADTTSKSRFISTQPAWTLDALGMADDFYLNILSWSCLNTVAFALGRSTYIWNADTGTVVRVGEPLKRSYVSSVAFSNDGTSIGIGTANGEVQVWDVETQKLSSSSKHEGQVASLSWNMGTLSSGRSDGRIYHHDVRQNRKTAEVLGHCGEAIAWCPWKPSLLASGGGTNDGTIRFWHFLDENCLHSLSTGSQVTSIRWAPHEKELLSTHGYSTNSIIVHAYPSLERVAAIKGAHSSRVLFSAVSPGGDVVCTGAGDQKLKFWRVWEGSKQAKRGKEARA